MSEQDTLMGLDFAVAGTTLLQVGLAYVLALPVAWDREQAERTAGLRTFPLVSVAACSYMLVGIHVLADPDAQARVFQAIIAGMGFIGGGAILKSDGSVSGTATAASLWLTGAIGIAVAFNRYELAVLMAVLNFITLRFVKKFKS